MVHMDPDLATVLDEGEEEDDELRLECKTAHRNCSPNPSLY